jgi:hypothetical protein
VGLQHRKCGSFSCKNRNRHKKQKKIVNVIFLRFGRYEIAFWSSSTEAGSTETQNHDFLNSLFLALQILIHSLKQFQNLI